MVLKHHSTTIRITEPNSSSSFRPQDQAVRAWPHGGVLKQRVAVQWRVQRGGFLVEWTAHVINLKYSHITKLKKWIPTTVHLYILIHLYILVWYWIISELSFHLFGDYQTGHVFQFTQTPRSSAPLLDDWKTQQVAPCLGSTLNRESFSEFLPQTFAALPWSRPPFTVDSIII